MKMLEKYGDLFLLVFIYHEIEIKDVLNSICNISIHSVKHMFSDIFTWCIMIKFKWRNYFSQSEIKSDVDAER